MQKLLVFQNFETCGNSTHKSPTYAQTTRMRNNSMLVVELFSTQGSWEVHKCTNINDISHKHNTLSANISRLEQENCKSASPLFYLSIHFLEEALEFWPRAEYIFWKKHRGSHLRVCLVLIILFRAASQNPHSSQSLVVKLTCICRAVV